MASPTHPRRPPPAPPLVTISCSVVSYLHTILGFGAFIGALILALSLHYKRVVKNGVAGYPDEWWPSVSATIGDWPQERSLMQVVIALMSGPRFALVLLSALLCSLSAPHTNRATLLAATGIARTFACAGWVYCTSTDFPAVHDVAMITYLVLTPAWMYISWGSLATKRDDGKADELALRARKSRRNTAVAFFASIPFMCLFYYRHKVLRIPGAYTTYSFFEWNLIVQDLLFDFCSLYDLSRLEFHVTEAAQPHTQFAGLLGGSWWAGGVARAVKDGAWSTPSVVAEAKSDSKAVDAMLGEGEAVEDTDEEGKGHGHPSSHASPLHAALAFISDSYLAFLWWTTLTALHPSIFFFSVYNLSIGGHEVLLVVQVFALAIALLIPSIKRRVPVAANASAPRASWLVTMHALTLLSIGTWWVPDALSRLVLTALANGFAAVLHVVDFSQAASDGAGSAQLQRKVATWLVGLLLSSLAKYAHHSNNPLWPFMNASNGGRHGVGLALAGVALLELAMRSGGNVQRNSARRVKRSPPPSTLASECRSALGMGTLLYALHMFLTDSGTMLTWGWTGYPIKGPMPIPHGWTILLAASLGTSLTLATPRTCSRHSLAFLTFLSLSTSVLLAFDDWTSFAGAVGVALTLPPLALPIVTRAFDARNDVLRVMTMAWLVADLLTFFQVLTVAYAFVPGAMAFRERTWVMLIVQAGAFAVALWGSGKADGVATSRPAASTRRVLYSLLAVITLAGFLVSSRRQVDPATIRPYSDVDVDPDTRFFTAGIQTVHFGLDQLFYDSTRRMSDLYADLRLDVFGLLESDLQRSVFGNRDLTQWLAEEMKMYADIGPGPDKHTWGAALFSKFPILESKHHLLPSPHGELAPAIHAVLDVFGTRVHVWLSHNGQEEDALDRAVQTDFIAREAAKTYPEPFVFLGYLVTKPHAPSPSPYGILFGNRGDDGQGLGRILDVEPQDDNRWCQYIGFRALERVGYVRVSRNTLTDTELQTAKFKVPPVGQTIDPDRDVRPRLVDDNQVPAIWHYPRGDYIDPTAMVYLKHFYYPYYYPRYYREAVE